jgi:tetratricopeptide (TPR) repeat protein
MAAMPGYSEPRMARHRAWMWTHRATALALAGDTAALPALAEKIEGMAARSSYGRDRRLRSYVTGLLLEARGDWEGARRAYEQAVWSPTENLAAARLARAALRTGRPRDATRVLEAYLRGPLDAANQYVPRWEVHQLLGEAYAALDLPARARPHYEWAERALARSEPSYRALLEGP